MNRKLTHAGAALATAGVAFAAPAHASGGPPHGGSSPPTHYSPECWGANTAETFLLFKAKIPHAHCVRIFLDGPTKWPARCPAPRNAWPMISIRPPYWQ